jgi:hypothetical protein
MAAARLIRVALASGAVERAYRASGAASEIGF